MSLILDALNRSQAERDSEGDVPGIETQHWIEPLPYAGRWQRGLPWLALGLALLVIVWLLFSRSGGTKEVAIQTPGEVHSNSAPAKLVEPELPKGFIPAPAPVDNLSVSKRESLQEPAGNSAAVENLYSATDEEPASVTPVIDTGSQMKHLAMEKPTSKPRENEQNIDIEEMVNLARQEAENAELSEHATPFLSQLSQQTKDQVPTIYYTQHDYSNTASKSSVTLNGKLVRVGGKVAGSIKLLDILPNSVVLSDRGTEFRLRALNSWINL